MRDCTPEWVEKVFAPGAPPGRIRMSLEGVLGRVVVSGMILTWREQLEELVGAENFV
jgi:hypothetical protein